jgi:5-methyltetrahydrofolate--homocysteine methyltransferase
MKLNLQFTPQDWERIKKDWSAWWNHELDRAMVVFGTKDISFVQHYEGWDVEQDCFPIDEVLDAEQKVLENMTYYGDSWPRWWPNFGAGIIAGFLGASVRVGENTIWFEPPDSCALADIRLEIAPDNFWWRWVKAITQAAVTRWGGQVNVCTTDLGGNMDILASFRGSQNLLIDLYDCPQMVEDKISEITHLWQHYFDALYEITKIAGNGTSPWAAMWGPGRFYMLQSDFSYMISPAMFERFVLPDIEACCNHLDHSFYHLDGKGQIAHLDMLLAIENLHGIQWIPGDGAPPPEQWLPLLKRIRDAEKLCQVYVTPAGAQTIARELGGKGFTFVIVGSPPDLNGAGFVKYMSTL